MIYWLIDYGGEERARLSEFLDRHRAAKGAARLAQRYFDHHVARDGAALSYYLLFALFPLLIFLNNLVAVWAIDLDGLLTQFAAVIPRDAVELLRQYLDYVSRVSSPAMMWFSLVFTVYFPYRAVNALFLSVRKAYGAGMPKRFLLWQFRVLLYTLLLILTLLLTIAVSAVGRRALRFIADYVYLSDGAIALWTNLRFVALGAVLFGMIALLYALALDERCGIRDVWPGVLASLAVWVGLSAAFSFYVEHAANYSVIYGSIGAIIVLLLWLYLSATMLIMGAEFNSVLLDAGKKQRRTT